MLRSLPHLTSRCLVLLGLALAALPLMAQRIDDSITAHYPFEGNLDEAAGIDTRPTVSGTLEYAPGALGRSVRIGDGDSIDFTGIPASTFSADFTVAWFMNLDSTGSHPLFGKETNCNSGQRFIASVSGGSPARLTFLLSNGTDTTTVIGSVPRRQWAHVALVRRGNEALIYVDGVAGRAETLPTLGFGSISGPFGLASSPCLGRTLGLLHPEGRFDELRIYPRALDAATVAGLARRPSFAAIPGSATPGAKIAVRASHLVVDRTYEVRITGSNRVTLFRGPATASSMSWTVDVPELAPGRYELELVAVLLRNLENVERSTAFVVAPRLGISSSASPQAGKKASFTVSNLVRGNQTRLFYGGRLLAGPEAASGSSHTFNVVLPRDFPASLPASVALRAEQLQGRSVSHLGTGSVNVAAPFTGRFAPVQQLRSNRTDVPADEKVQITGQLNFADGANASNTQISAYWVGDDGSMTPLPTSALALANDGSLRLDTRPPSLSSMTAVRPQVGGHIRLAKKRTNQFGLVEWEFEEGPRLETALDVDPDTDITVRVTLTTGEPLEGAYVVLSSAAPLGYAFNPPPQDNLEGPPIGGGAAYLHRQPNLNLGQPTRKTLGNRPVAVNQLSNEIVDLPPPPAPACGNELFRRYTDASGRAEFPIKGGSNESPDSWQMMQSIQIVGTDCSSLIGCEGIKVSRVYSFDVTVYTLHRGAGYRISSGRQEEPTRFRVTYYPETETFSIRNLRNNTVTEQQTSANLQVQVPVVEDTDNLVIINDPFMLQVVGGQPFSFVGSSGGTSGNSARDFGQWIEFNDTRVSEFSNAPTGKQIHFDHFPDANGSLSRARFYLTGRNGSDSLIGDFEQRGFVDGCNLQDNPGNNRSERWVLDFPSQFDNDWRFPVGIFYSEGAERRACGYILAENARGGTARRNVCFNWQQAPLSMRSGIGRLIVNDTDMNDVRVVDAGATIGAAATTVPKRPTAFLGKEIKEPGQVDNSTVLNEAVDLSISASGQSSGAQQLLGINPEQFNQGAAGAQSLINAVDGGGQVSIGSDEYDTVLDATIPLFKWYWGIPEILSAEVFAELRLIAKYYFGGNVRLVGGKPKASMLTNAAFLTLITIGVDIDVLLGLVVDAGATISGMILSEMPIVVEDGVVRDIGPCFTFQLIFSYYIDPCPICPTPVIRDSEPVLEAQDPPNCSFYSAKNLGKSPAANAEIAALSKLTAKDLAMGFDVMRDMRRHPTLDFDLQGNGQLVMLDGGRQLVANQISEVGITSQAVLTAAMGVRGPQVAYYDTDRAVAVWAESALPESQFVAAAYQVIARNQRLAYAEWDGEQWGEKRILTEAGTGEGQVTLAACPAGRSGCPAAGEVLAVWQRDANGNSLNPQHRLWHARFTPGGGFGTVASIDPTPTAGVQDITPTATYVAGRPVVVWSRQFGGNLSDFSKRFLAYRVLPDGAPRPISAAPRATSPSVAATPSGLLKLAWLSADPNTVDDPDAGTAGAVGTQHKLHVAQASCDATKCNFSDSLVPPARDEHNRRIYGERPTLKTAGDDVFMVMRVFRFEGEASEQVQPGDPIGTVINSADVVRISANFATGDVRILKITADGALHMSTFAGYNHAMGSIVTGSSVFAPPAITPFRDALKATGFKGHIAYAKRIGSSGPVELRAMVNAPDLAVEQVTGLDALSPSSSQRTQVRIGNRGSGYSTSRDGVVQVELRWNSPGGALLASASLDDIGSGGERTIELAWTAPASAHPDEGGVLYALIVPAAGFDEVTDDNNLGQLDYPGMPVPQHLASSAIPGIPQVQLGWDPIDDARIEGYRVYRQEADSSWTPMGASPAHGFLDLSASFLVPRTYAVSTYSARGVESPLSKAITVMPVPAVQSLLPFVDGFEGEG